MIATAAALFIILLPRLLWQPGDAAEGSRFMVAVALYWNVVYITSLASPLLFVLSCWATPRVWLPLIAIYVISCMASRPELREGAGWPGFAQKEWGYHAFRRFLRLRLYVSKTLQKRPVDQEVVIGVHPHGIAADYRILMDGMLYDALPGRQILSLSASVLYYIPVVRELALWTRCIDARKKVAAGALQRGHSIMVIPGGEHEQIRTKKGHEEVYLANRVGFVKLALEANAALVPSYAFGCVDLYDTYTFLHGPREWIRKTLGVCIPIT